MNEYNPDYVSHPLDTVIETLDCKSELCIDGLDFGYWQDYAHNTGPLTETAVQVIEKLLSLYEG